MSLTVADDGGLRPASPCLPEWSRGELAMVGVDAATIARVDGTVPLGDLVAGVAAGLGAPEGPQTVVVGAVGADGRLRLVPPRHGSALVTAPIERVVLPIDDVTLVAELRAARGDAIRPHLLPVARLSEAIRAALPGLDAALSAGTIQPETGALIERGLRGPEPTLLGWEGLHHLAIGALRRTTDAGADDSFLLALVRDVTARHLGFDYVVPWPDDARLGRFDRPRRLEVLAHVVQSAADGDWGRARSYAKSAAQWLAPDADREPSDAMLLGAIGRAYAAAGAGGEAAEALEAAIATWQRLGRGDDASYSFSELVRVCAIEAPARARARLEASAAWRAELSEPGRTFVRLAVGRAWAQLGELDEAIDALSEPMGAWASAPAHAAQARWRWLAWAARRNGDLARAASAMEALRSLGPSEQLHLAELDDALDRGAALEAPLEALCDLPVRGAEAHRWLDAVAPGRSLESVARDRETVRGITQRWRY